MRTGITRIEEGKDDVPDEEMSPEFLDSAGKWIQKMGVGLSLFLIIIWPLVTVCWGVFRPVPPPALPGIPHYA